MSLESSDFAKTYEPSRVESRLRSYWADNAFFKATRDPAREPFTIVIPPPNITSDLHMGHMLNNTVQDVLIRWNRALGKVSCWIPGTDHASIATEAQVTKALAAKGIDKRAIGRDAFLEHAWEWKRHVGGRIVNILKTLGISCDWSREAFTMSPEYSRAVLTAFVQLYNEGYVYRGTRLVNWCPFSQSVISDEEVDNEERAGHFWHIHYKVEGDAGRSLVVATTRPETLFGDLAVAVHPDDERYRDLIGKNVIVPVANRAVPVIADAAVEKDFGTGCLKVTPSHDPTDFEIGARHNLGHLNVMNKDASLNDKVPAAYQGLSREAAREKVVAELKELGLLEKAEPMRHVVGISERGKVPIEYYLSEQWYVRMDEFAKLALDATRSKELTIVPAYWEKTWEYWLTNIKDWCVSRQLWWGHRIPAYTCSKGHLTVSVDAPTACKECGDTHFTQDPDVLDTWASSWLWPFAVHNSANPTPEQKADLDYFYPTDVIVTGPDIIFFWIARMVMAGKHFRGKTPFHHVYFTGLVRDKQGRKMSKSLGNFPDTFKIIEKYGTDALRFSLVNQLVTGQDIKWDENSCEIGKTFANKLWNASRFLAMAAELVGVDPARVSVDDLDWNQSDPVLAWILTEYKQVLERSFKAIESYEFSDYSKATYEFIWMRLCDWFVELIKPRIYGDATGTPESKATVTVALQVLEGGLRLLHPLMPYVTEELWQRLGGTAREGKSVGLQKLARAPKGNADEAALAEMDVIRSIVTGVRKIRGDFSIHPGETLQVVVDAPAGRLERFLVVLEALAKVKVGYSSAKPSRAASLAAGDVRYFVVLPDTVDVEAERGKIFKKLEKVESNIRNVEGKLSSDSFTKGAPEHVVEGARQQLAQNQLEKSLLEETLTALR